MSGGGNQAYVDAFPRDRSRQNEVLALRDQDRASRLKAVRTALEAGVAAADKVEAAARERRDRAEKALQQATAERDANEARLQEARRALEELDKQINELPSNAKNKAELEKKRDQRKDEVRKAEANTPELEKARTVASSALDQALDTDDENLIEQRINEVATAQAAQLRMRIHTEMMIRRELTSEQLATLRGLGLQV